MTLEIYIKLCVAEPDFLGILLLPKILINWTKNGPNTGFLNLSKKIDLYLFYNESLYYLLYSCKNPIFGKVFIPEI